MKVEERKISVEEVVEAMKKGKLQDAFGTGTAATITQISVIHHDGKDYELPPVNTRKYSNKLNDELMNIKLGKSPDKFGWIYRIKA
jgi:branched-chain amino acid aminotransferase